ncbi:MAG: VOC family protein, partial [Acidimicrobiia bacterium]|nr:VOC family protein [Acidimicrobiia bacterium]
MSRIRPDGVELSWRLAVPPDPSLAGVMPFLIEWGAGSHHPCDTLVQFLDLVDLFLSHPDPVPIGNAIAAASDTKINVSEGPVELRARFHSDQGIVNLSSIE